MKIRCGFVTNSSSTNFILMIKGDLNVDILFKGLGFKDNSLFGKEGWELCNEMMRKITCQPQKVSDFIDKQNDKIKTLIETKLNEGYKIFIGETSDEDGGLAAYFTSDKIKIETDCFYIDASDFYY